MSVALKIFCFQDNRISQNLAFLQELSLFLVHKTALADIHMPKGKY